MNKSTNAAWKDIAVDALKRGQCVQVRPRGSSMKGLINDGDLVTLAPCNVCDVIAGDVVLARVEGRRFRHVVLHRVVSVEQGRFLIGSNSRLDGWVQAEEVLGRVVQVVHSEETPGSDLASRAAP